jgi:hypothetical protein
MSADHLAPAVPTRGRDDAPPLFLGKSKGSLDILLRVSDPASHPPCWHPSSVDESVACPQALYEREGRPSSSRDSTTHQVCPVVAMAERGGMEACTCRSTHARDGGRQVITNQAQCRATKAHLRQFEEAAANLEGKTDAGTRSKLQQLELDAIRSQANELRSEIEEYEQARDPGCPCSRRWQHRARAQLRAPRRSGG